MKPDPDKARELLEAALKNAVHNLKADGTELISVIETALCYIKGYNPDLAKYHCSFCGVSGVKLWRGVGTTDPAWCSKCGTAQAGLEDTIDDEGRIAHILPPNVKWMGPGTYDRRIDQIYSPKQGQNLLPWVPTEEGYAWGYTSVPMEGVMWWRTLPTRKETT